MIPQFSLVTKASWQLLSSCFLDLSEPPLLYHHHGPTMTTTHDCFQCEEEWNSSPIGTVLKQMLIKETGRRTRSKRSDQQKLFFMGVSGITVQKGKALVKVMQNLDPWSQDWGGCVDVIILIMLSFSLAPLFLFAHSCRQYVTDLVLVSAPLLCSSKSLIAGRMQKVRK